MKARTVLKTLALLLCLAGGAHAQWSSTGTDQGEKDLGEGWNSVTFGTVTVVIADGLTVNSVSGNAIGTDLQAYDVDLDDLADGSLTGSKVGTGVSASNITTGGPIAIARGGTNTASLVTDNVLLFDGTDIDEFTDKDNIARTDIAEVFSGGNLTVDHDLHLSGDDDDVFIGASDDLKLSFDHTNGATIENSVNNAEHMYIYNRSHGERVYVGAENASGTLKTTYYDGDTGWSMGSQIVAAVADPSAAQDAATKNYVDTAGGGGAAGKWTNGGICTQSGTGSCGSWDFDSYTINEVIFGIHNGGAADNLDSEWRMYSMNSRQTTAGTDDERVGHANGQGGGTGSMNHMYAGNWGGSRNQDVNFVTDGSCSWQGNPSTNVFKCTSVSSANCSCIWEYR